MREFEDKHPRGPRGRFRHKSVAEAPGGLGELVTSPVLDPRALAADPDPDVRVEALRCPAVPPDVLADLADPATQPFQVRHAVASTFYAGVAERASHDPHPVVRAIAYYGWDLPDADRRRLQSDPKVVEVLTLS